MIVTGYTSINAIVKAELFPTKIRALGVGLPYALTVAIFGGTAEYVALWFKNAGHESWYSSTTSPAASWSRCSSTFDARDVEGLAAGDRGSGLIRTDWEVGRPCTCCWSRTTTVWRARWSRPCTSTAICRPGYGAARTP